MSALQAHAAGGFRADLPAAVATAMPEPVVLGGGCFGWYHPVPAGAEAPRGRAVLLCGPQGQEAAWVHRGWRELAATLAEAGLPVLRFDWPGTGDSAGDEAPGLPERWLSALETAADWLRERSGAPELALCGLRLGATIAALAAARRPGAYPALALLAPILSGRTHVRHLTLAAMASSRGPAPAAMPDWLETAGFRLHRRDLDALSGVEMAPALARAGAARLLLLEAPMQPRLGDAAAQRLRALGSTLLLRPFEGFGAFLRDAHLSETPRTAFAETAAWLAEGAPALEVLARDALHLGAAPAPTAFGARPAPASPALAAPCLSLAEEGALETPLRFGPDDGLFGMLCEPRPSAWHDRRAAVPPPAVLMLNTGAIPHAGNGRMAVTLARRLATAGVASLRMDLAGIGDSAPPLDAAQGPDAAWIFRAGVQAEVRAALDLLQARGHGQVLAVGVCSGAHHAFQAALRDPRIVGLALANLPAFDRAAGGAPALDGGPPPGEHPRLRRARMLLRRLAAEADTILAEGFGIESRLDRPGRWMRSLSARGVSVLLAYSAGDRGLRELRAHFGRGGRRLGSHPLVRRVVLPGTDHALTPCRMRDAFQALVLEELARHHGVAEAATAAAAHRMGAGPAAPQPDPPGLPGLRIA